MKLPVGKLFSPRPKEKNVIENEDPAEQHVSGLTSATEDLTEVEDSPRTGKSNIFGKLRRNEDDPTGTSEGKTSGHPRRRSSGALNILRKGIFSHNKEDTNNTTEALRDAREISESFQIDPLFDEFTPSRPSSVRPPSVSDLSLSETQSSIPESSPTSTNVASIRKVFEKQSDGMTQPPPRSTVTKMTPSRLPYSNNSHDVDAQNSRNEHGKAASHSEADPARRSPRPMKTGVGNSLVSSMMISSRLDDASEPLFQPTLSQKLKIGNQEIEKKIQVRKKPPLEPLSFVPLINVHDRQNGSRESRAVNMAGKVIPAATETTSTTKKSNIVNVPTGVPERAVQSAIRPTTPTYRERPSSSPSSRSRGSSQQSRHRRAQQSREKRAERQKNNSDATSRSRGRSGPRHEEHLNDESPTSHRHRTSNDRKNSHNHSKYDRNEDSSTKSPSKYKSNSSPGRLRSGSGKSPSHYRRPSDRHHDTPENSQKQPRKSQNQDRLPVDEKKRSKSLDESLSRDKSICQEYSDSNHQSHQSDHDDSKGIHYSPHSRDSDRKQVRRAYQSSETEERKRSKSMDDSISRSKHSDHPSPQARRPSHSSRPRQQNEVGILDRPKSQESSHHRRSVDRHLSIRSEEGPNLTERKRTISIDESFRSDHESSTKPCLPSVPIEAPSGKGDNNQRSQKVGSKAEIAQRDEPLVTKPSSATSRRSSSSSRRHSYHEDPMATKQMQELLENSCKDDLNGSYPKSNRESTSPNRRSSYSSHHKVPNTPSGRSVRTRTRSSPREKWDEMIQRNDSKKDKVDDLVAASLTVPSSGKYGGRTTGSSLHNESILQDDSVILSPTARTTHRKSVAPPETTDGARIPRSPILTPNHYRAVNKMADKTFHSPLGESPGLYSPTESDCVGSSTSPGRTPPLDTSNRINEEGEERKSRTANLKSHLRQLEQQHSSMNSSNKSRGMDYEKNSTVRSTTSREQNSNTYRGTGTRNQRRQRETEDRNRDDARKPPTKKRSESKGRTASKLSDPRHDSSSGHGSRKDDLQASSTK